MRRMPITFSFVLAIVFVYFFGSPFIQYYRNLTPWDWVVELQRPIAPGTTIREDNLYQLFAVRLRPRNLACTTPDFAGPAPVSNRQDELLVSPRSLIGHRLKDGEQVSMGCALTQGVIGRFERVSLPTSSEPNLPDRLQIAKAVDRLADRVERSLLENIRDTSVASIRINRPNVVFEGQPWQIDLPDIHILPPHVTPDQWPSVAAPVLNLSTPRITPDEWTRVRSPMLSLMQPEIRPDAWNLRSPGINLERPDFVPTRSNISHIYFNLNCPTFEQQLPFACSTPMVPTHDLVDRPRTSEALSSAASLARQRPRAWVLLLGRADPPGSEQYNWRLSQARATYVRDRLIEHGVERNRILLISLGEPRPAPPSRATDLPDPVERRVDIVLVD